ncbi:MAG: diacylglycerol kinase [Pseudotabrizicola sp.]|uniref:diacylglycerol kinase n=1 Tax=Pseudotabrizicola sp. TaxID=2939647 RepID=UPI002716DA41|nr:diacylglycerol kinase [Pseudotabrizicola sp.]MDO8881645.1 diacylglycerol kinase [Pseudotabrizicola sp.]MDP2081945.1 diacylglycerol kinase [Pseudotabrizicola sp.]MDZ7576017.1 diacylglycerol kinase [Pseudotabrizicola sp.]
MKPARKGLWHMIDATCYSLAGFRRLMAETAARLELAGGAMAVLLLLWVGANSVQWLGFVVLFAALLAFEALNTALELLVDHISPGWSEMAKQAKDLGSLAVGLMILANAAYVGLIVWQAVAN